MIAAHLPESAVFKSLPIVIAAVILVACGGPLEITEPGDVGQVADEIRQVAPTGKGVGTRTSVAQRTRYRVKYHAGPVMLGTNHVYFIFYGNWAGSTAPQILTDFVASLGGSAYYGINTQYTDSAGTPLSNSLLWASNLEDAYSHGTTLSDADVAGVVSGAILGEQLPLDPQGLYFVVGSADVDVSSGLCTSYCGFHQSTTVAGISVRYGFVGDAQRCPNQCAPQLTGPNGNFGADAMVSTVATLISGIVSNPTLTGWYDTLGLDGADKCAWSYGTTYQAANGALANLALGGKDYLVPLNWVMSKKGGACALSLAQAAELPELLTVD